MVEYTTILKQRPQIENVSCAEWSRYGSVTLSVDMHKQQLISLKERVALSHSGRVHKHTIAYLLHRCTFESDFRGYIYALIKDYVH